MEFPPMLYHLTVRQKWFLDMYIRDVLGSNFNLNDGMVLDFGCGVGSSCFMLKSSNYLGIDCDKKE